MCLLTIVQLWVIAESMEHVPSPTASAKLRTSSTMPSPSSSLPPQVTTPTPSRRRRRKIPVSIPTLHLINNSAATASRPLSPAHSIPDHATANPSAALSLASTFIVAGQSKVITALPSDPAVTRLPKHLSVAAAHALQSNLQVPPLPQKKKQNVTFVLNFIFYCPPGFSRRMVGCSGTSKVQQPYSCSIETKENAVAMAARAGGPAREEV